MNIWIKTIVVTLFIAAMQTSAFAGSKEYCRIGGKQVAVAGIPLSTDFHIKGNSTAAEISYTFYLDKRDLDIALSHVDSYLHSNNSYKVMAAILLKYIQDDFKNYPCSGSNKCVKNINVSIKAFFDYLNAHEDLKKMYLESAISTAMFAPRYKRMDDFLFNVALKAGYALYGISYMRVDFMFGWTLMDKMIYSVRHDGYNGGL